jgi:quercetin dioxygenase-like cupin family protein
MARRRNPITGYILVTGMVDTNEAANSEQTYQHLHFEDAPDAPSRTTHKYEVDRAVGATEFGLNRFVAEPGQRVPWGRHAHPDHEEAFYVISGTVAFTVGPLDEAETVQVGPGEIFYVPANTYQTAVAVGDNQLEMLAVGAPKSTDGATIEEKCSECGEVTGRDFDVVDAGETYVLYCDACDAEVDRLVSGS